MNSSRSGNESATGSLNSSGRDTPSGPSYDPSYTTAQLVRREQSFLVFGAIVPVLIEVAYHQFLGAVVSTGFVHAALIAFGAMAIPAYLFSLNVQSELRSFLPTFDYKSTAFEIERLNALDQPRAWKLFWLLNRISDVCAFFVGFVLSALVSRVTEPLFG